MFSKESRICTSPISQPATSFRMGTPCGPISQWLPSKRLPGLAKRAASSWFSSPSMWTPRYCVLATAGQDLELRAMLNVNRGGLADSDATDVAVNP